MNLVENAVVNYLVIPNVLNVMKSIDWFVETVVKKQTNNSMPTACIMSNLFLIVKFLLGI